MLDATLPLPDYFEDYADYITGTDRAMTAKLDGNDYELAVRVDFNTENEPLYLVYFARDGKLVEHFITTYHEEAILHWNFLNDRYRVSVWADEDAREAQAIYLDSVRDYYDN